MRKFSLKKVLFGLSVSLVLAMAIGSFAIGEVQTPVTPQNAQVKTAVSAPTSGDFTVTATNEGTVLTDADYSYSGGVLTIKSTTPMTIKNTDETTPTTDRIVINSDSLAQGDTVNLTLAGVNISTDSGPALEIAYDAIFDVEIILQDKTENKLVVTDKNRHSALQKAGTYDASVGTLFISGKGNLLAQSKTGAGIGSSYGEDDNGGCTKNVIFNGGNIRAIAELGACAAIGGGYDDLGYAKNIVINDGTIYAENTAGQGAGIGVGCMGALADSITINGGDVTAIGSSGSAGIGSGNQGSVDNIIINGGTVKATGGSGAAGIGGGANGGNGTNITINGGNVTATGGSGAAGIGGGTPMRELFPPAYVGGNGVNIKLNGGSIYAIGGSGGAAVGGGKDATGSASNTFDGNATVKAAVDEKGKSAFDGFDAGLTKGLTFTGKVTDYTSEEITVSWQNGTLYGTNYTITDNFSIPINFTFEGNTSITLAEDAELSCDEDCTLTIKGQFHNEGVVNISDDCLIVNNSGSIDTLLKYDPQGGKFSSLDDSYQLYKDSSGAGKSYTNLPTEVTNATFNGWKRNADGTGAKLSESTVDLNLHQAYADMDYTVTFDSQGGSDVSPVSPIKYKSKVTKPTDPTREGYTFDTWYKEESCTNKWDFDKDTVQGDTTLYAGWEAEPTPTPPTPTPPGPEPTPTPPGPEPGPTPEPTPDPSVNPDGDGSGSGSSSKTSDPFMGGMALALLGVATTGAVLVRKRK